jgi:AbiTii
LNRKIKNEKFRQWLNWELDGYFNGEQVPDYREFHCVNMGLFVGLRVQLNNQPIPMHILSEREREAMETLKLRQPAASYNSEEKTPKYRGRSRWSLNTSTSFSKGATRS